MAHLVLGTRVQCPMQKTWVYSPKDRIYFIWEKLRVHHKCGQNGKSTASAMAGSRNLRQTQDFSVSSQKTFLWAE